MSESIEQFSRRVLALPAEWQVAFLAASVEHVSRVAEEVGAVPDYVTNDVLTPALECAWNFAGGGEADKARIGAVEARMDELWEQLAERMRNDVAHLAEAATLLISGLPSPRGRIKQLINNLDAFVALVDPSDEEGVDEEDGWRRSMLDQIESVASRSNVDRSAFESFLRIPAPWASRFAADWNA